MQQWLNMQMCLKASVLCRAVVKAPTTHYRHASFSVCGCDATAWMQNLDARRRESYPPPPRRGSVPHPNGRVATLSVVAERKESASCSYQVYSKYDSWTSGYRPHITQAVNPAPG
ncbi:unnamed protein product [Ophioblennius macclurei]